ncbi:MAG: acyltransferase family protein [Chitinophagaceae bacterium]
MWDYIFNSRKILSRSRHPWIDYARGISIILVCFRHIFGGVMTEEKVVSNYPVLEYINIFFFSFRMPLFFIVSGIFFKLSLGKKGTGNFIKNRAQTILYPLIVWGAIHITIQLIFPSYVNANRQPYDYFKLLYQPRSVEQFWYLNALFFVSILYTLVNVYARLNSVRQLGLGILLYAIAGYLHMNSIELGFITDVFFFYFFYAVGDIASDFMLNPENYKKIASFKTLLFIIPFFIVIQHYFTVLNITNKNDYYVQNYQPALFALAALVGGSFVICVSFLLQKLDKLRFLRVIGYHSLYIYVTNLMVTAATRVIMVRFFHINDVGLLLLAGTITGIVIPIVFYNIAVRMGAWWLYTLKKPSRESSILSMKFPEVDQVASERSQNIVKRETSI